MLSIMMISDTEKVIRNIPFSKEAVSVFFQSLDVMWKSMAGIFGVILVFYIVILLLGRIGKSNE
ncbi:MAG: hypothetical protein K0R09_2712 [Clostridiales bacterium]|jgi:hypothetical protein|nr:hypothetical protein [Clostridiales bacterium]